MDSYLSQWHEHEEKCKQHRPGFELDSPIPFPTTITVTLCTPPKTFSFVTLHPLSCVTLHPLSCVTLRPFSRVTLRLFLYHSTPTFMCHSTPIFVSLHDHIHVFHTTPFFMCHFCFFCQQAKPQPKSWNNPKFFQSNVCISFYDDWIHERKQVGCFIIRISCVFIRYK